MNGLLLALVGVIYFIVAVGYCKDGNTGMAIAFLCYALANYGLYLAGR